MVCCRRGGQWVRRGVTDEGFVQIKQPLLVVLYVSPLDPRLGQPFEASQPGLS